MTEARLFLLTGHPKSGTTFLMRLLDALPGVLCRGEGRFFSSRIAGVPSLREGLESGLGDWIDFVAHRKRNWLRTDAAIETVERQNVLGPGALAAAQRETCDRIAGAAVRRLLLDAAALEPGTTLVGDKTPVLAAEELDAARRALPAAPVLFLRREPADFVVSLLLHHWRAMKGDRPDRALDVLDFEDFERVDAHLDSGEPRPALVSPETAARLARARSDVVDAALGWQARDPRSVCVLEYERLWEEPGAVLHSALAFLGGEAEPAEVERAVAAHDAGAVARGHDDALRAHVHNGRPGEGRRRLDAAALAAIDAASRS